MRAAVALVVFPYVCATDDNGGTREHDTPRAQSFAEWERCCEGAVTLITVCPPAGPVGSFPKSPLVSICAVSAGWHCKALKARGNGTSVVVHQPLRPRYVEGDNLDLNLLVRPWSSSGLYPPRSISPGPTRKRLIVVLRLMQCSSLASGARRSTRGPRTGWLDSNNWLIVSSNARRARVLCCQSF